MLTTRLGHGVVLSATWLLPVALIPSAWDCDLPPVTIHRDKTPTGEDNVEPSRSGKREDASAEGKSNATTRCSHSWKGKEKARE
jgi:hypothetical protein